MIHNVFLALACFRFPSNGEKRNLWIAAVGRWKWHPTRFSHICSEHFLSTDYSVPPGMPRPRLNPSAVPSVFPDSPKHLRKESLKKRQAVNEQPDFNIMEKEKEGSEPVPNSPKHRMMESQKKREQLITEQPNLTIRKDEKEQSELVSSSPKQLMTESSKKRRQLITEQSNIKIRKAEIQKSESVPAPDPSSLLIKKLRKKIKVLHQKVRRRDKRLKALREYVNGMKRRTVLSLSSTGLTDNFSSSFVELFINEFKNGLENLLGGAAQMS